MTALPMGQKMRDVGEIIRNELPGLGFTLLVFEYYKPGIANYISTARREDMIKTMEELLEKWKANDTFDTPEEG